MRLYFPVDLTGNLIMIEKLVSGRTWTGDLPIFSPDALTTAPSCQAMYVYGCTQLVVQPYTVDYINMPGFYHVIPNLVVRNKPNLDCFQGKYRRSDAVNIGSVCLTVCGKLVYRQAESCGPNELWSWILVYRQTRRIHKRLYSYRKKALKSGRMCK